MLSFLKNLLLKQEIKNNTHVKQFTNWHLVKNSCIVVANSPGLLGSVKDFISESEKEMDIIIYTNDKHTRIKEVFLSLNRKDLTMFEMPKPEIVKKLKQKNYDLVICGDLNNTFVLQALTLLLRSKCVIGNTQMKYSSYFDIAISEESGDFAKFLKDLLKYLRMIKAN